MLNNSEIVLINEIIEKIYTIEDYKKMRVALLNMLNVLIHCKRSTLYIASKEKEHLLADPVGAGISPSELQRYIDVYEELDYTRWIFMSGKTLLYRETDLFSDQEREGEPYYKDMYMRSKIYYSAQMSIACNGVFLGILSLYREKTDQDFTDAELFILSLLSNHLEYRMNREWQRDKGGNTCDDRKNKVFYDAYRFITNYGLTMRETEVLGLLFTAMSNQRICKALVISPNTLKKHQLSIYKKLGINHRWELIDFKK